jgi:hypothetical protein
MGVIDGIGGIAVIDGSGAGVMGIGVAPSIIFRAETMLSMIRPMAPGNFAASRSFSLSRSC